MRILIVGAAPSHLAAAARLRRLDETAKIIVISEAGESPETALLRRRYRIEMRSFTRFVSAEMGYSNVVTLEDTLTKHIYQEEFDKIINMHEADSRTQNDLDVHIDATALDSWFDADIAAHLAPHVQGLANVVTTYRKFGGISGHGRQIADEIFGYKLHIEEPAEMQSVDVSGLKLTCFGQMERGLNARQMPYMYSILPIAGGFLKLIYDDAGGILGFAALGEKPVAEHCADVMTTLLKMGGNIKTIMSLQLADSGNPLYTLAKIAHNVVEKRLFMAYADEIKHLVPHETILLDVRHQLEFMDGRIHGSINIPLEALRDSIYRLERTKEIITICGDGKESYLAARILMGHGYKTRHLTGGLAYARPITDPAPQFYPREVL